MLELNLHAARCRSCALGRNSCAALHDPTLLRAGSRGHRNQYYSRGAFLTRVLFLGFPWFRGRGAVSSSGSPLAAGPTFRSPVMDYRPGLPTRRAVPPGSLAPPPPGAPFGVLFAFFSRGSESHSGPLLGPPLVRNLSPTLSRRHTDVIPVACGPPSLIPGTPRPGTEGGSPLRHLAGSHSRRHLESHSGASSPGAPLGTPGPLTHLEPHSGVRALGRGLCASCGHTFRGLNRAGTSSRAGYAPTVSGAHISENFGPHFGGPSGPHFEKFRAPFRRPFGPPRPGAQTRALEPARTKRDFRRARPGRLAGLAASKSDPIGAPHFSFSGPPGGALALKCFPRPRPRKVFRGSQTPTLPTGYQKISSPPPTGPSAAPQTDGGGRSFPEACRWVPTGPGLQAPLLGLARGRGRACRPLRGPRRFRPPGVRRPGPARRERPVRLRHLRRHRPLRLRGRLLGPSTSSPPPSALGPALRRRRRRQWSCPR